MMWVIVIAIDITIALANCRCWRLCNIYSLDRHNFCHNRHCCWQSLPMKMLVLQSGSSSWLPIYHCHALASVDVSNLLVCCCHHYNCHCQDCQDHHNFHHIHKCDHCHCHALTRVNIAKVCSLHRIMNHLSSHLYQHHQHQHEHRHHHRIINHPGNLSSFNSLRYRHHHLSSGNAFSLELTIGLVS